MTGLAAGDLIQPGLYRLPEAPIGAKVLIPGFQRAKLVRGAFGWFTAGWIERLAPGWLNISTSQILSRSVSPSPQFFTPKRGKSFKRRRPCLLKNQRDESQKYS